MPSRMTISIRPAMAPACSLAVSIASTAPCRPTSPTAVITALSASSTSKRGSGYVSISIEGKDGYRDDAIRPFADLPAGGSSLGGRGRGIAHGLRQFQEG
ncbi:exported hypothetical protein [Mesorhizobium sp. STM 4661]|nr:exported hypothetical protein [Mesorhizobium sp. STM 4661]